MALVCVVIPIILMEDVVAQTILQVNVVYSQADQIMANKGHKICTFDSFNLTEKEYLMYLFKYNILQKELYGEELK